MRNEAYAKQCDALFEGRHIFNPALNPDVAKIKSEMGQYPAIFINFALLGDDFNKEDPTKPDWGKIKGLIVGRIAELFTEFYYLARNLISEIEIQTKRERIRKIKEYIKEYKEAFNAEEVPQSVQSKIYDTVSATELNLQAKKDLEAFERLRNGNPKDEKELSNSINFLAQLLSEQHGKPTYIFVDEYDSLINKYFNHEEILSHLTQTFGGLFSAFAKPNKSINDHLKSIIFTGILRVAKANIFSELNNLEECTVFDKLFSPYYGFTPEEVRELLHKTNRNAALPEVERWYNGYKIGETIIYNPWSVMRFMDRGEFDTYWINTARPGLIRDIIINNKGHMINNQLRQVIKNGVHKTMSVEANKSVSVEDLSNPESIWSFLLHTGYLTAEHAHYNEESGMFDCQVRIPNTEINGIYRSIIRFWLHTHAAIIGAIANIFEQNYEGLADNLQKMVESQYSSALFAREEDSVEAVYHSLLLSELNKDASREQYALLPEQYTGQGRADILFIDNKNKILVPIELKRAYTLKSLMESATTAVTQAANKKYGEDPQYQGYTHHPAIGVSFFDNNPVLKVAQSEISVERIQETQ
jgi:hypothetical protein